MIHPTLGLGPEQEILRRRNKMTKKHLKKMFDVSSNYGIKSKQPSNLFLSQAKWPR